MPPDQVSLFLLKRWPFSLVVHGHGGIAWEVPSVKGVTGFNSLLGLINLGRSID